MASSRSRPPTSVGRLQLDLAGDRPDREVEVVDAGLGELGGVLRVDVGVGLERVTRASGQRLRGPAAEARLVGADLQHHGRIGATAQPSEETDEAPLLLGARDVAVACQGGPGAREREVLGPVRGGPGRRRGGGPHGCDCLVVSDGACSPGMSRPSGWWRWWHATGRRGRGGGVGRPRAPVPLVTSWGDHVPAAAPARAEGRRLHAAQPARRGRHGRGPPRPPRRRSPGRAEGAASPHRRGRRGPGAARARGELALPDPQPLGRRDRRLRPVGRDPLRRHPLRPRPLAPRVRRRGGSDPGRRPPLVRRVPGRGPGHGPRRRRAPPRREAVQRADGGPHPDPHRLRAGPRRRRPEADPHRLAARHARLPRARDPLRRRRDGRLRRPLVGGDGGVRGHRPAAVRSRPVDGDHGPGPPRRARPVGAPRRPAPDRRRRARPRPDPPADPRHAA